MKCFSLRLSPKTDLRKSLEEWVQHHQLSAAWIVTGMGSLSQIAIRFAGQDRATVQEGTWEICSLAGTLSTDGVHIHIVVSDENGHCLGGHLMAGCMVRTTAELVLGVDDTVVFSRVFDPQTGYPELNIQERQ